MFSSHPLLRRFENELMVGGQHLEWTMRGKDFCFRPFNGDMGVIWCQLSRRDVPTALERPAARERVLKRLERDLESKQFWRFWPLDEEKEVVFNSKFVLFGYNDDDFWLRLEWTEPKDEQVLYYADMSSLVVELEPTKELAALVQSLRQRGQLNWFVCVRGDMEKLESVLNACMALWGHYILYCGRGNLNFASLLHAPDDASTEQWHQLHRVQEILNRHFELKWTPFAGCFCNREGRKERKPHLYVCRPLALSQHERLEALLVLCDFLRDKLPPEEIESLLKT